MKVDLDLVIAFRAVAAEGSFTKAGIALHSCQSRMSAKVKALEERLRTRLFTRSTRFVELTKSGQLLLTYANQLAETVSDIEAVADTLWRGSENILRLGAPGCTATLPERANLTDLFERRKPGIRLEIDEGMPMVLLERLYRHQIDVALIPGPLPSDDLEMIPIHTIRNMLVIPDNHIFARMDSVAPERLRNQQIVFSPRETHPALYDDIITPLERLGAEVLHCPETHTLARVRYARRRSAITWSQGFENLNFAEHNCVLRPIDGVVSHTSVYLVRRKDCELTHVDALWSCAHSLFANQPVLEGAA